MRACSIFLATLGLALSSNAALPACTPESGKYNETLNHGTLIQELITVSNAGAGAGMGSGEQVSYHDFGEQIPGWVQPVTDNTNIAWTPSLQQAVIKCSICRNATTRKVQYSHVRKHPIMSNENLKNLFGDVTALLTTIRDKQCNRTGYTPPSKVKKAMRPLIDSLWASMGVGPTLSSQVGVVGIPAGAILPYYDCFVKYGAKDRQVSWQDAWFTMNQVLFQINQTNCVAH